MALNQNSEPLVSVMMPAFNAARFIGPAIESIINQTYPNWELIVVDDGSNDDTYALAKAYADQDTRIHVYKEPHTGRGQARNKVLAHCRGEYVAVCDADDVFVKERFALQVAFLLANPEVAAVGSQCVSFINEPGDMGNSIVKWPVNAMDIASVFEKHKMGMPNSASMIRSRMFEQYGGYDRRLLRAQDYGFYLKLHRAGEKFANLPEVLTHYRNIAPIPSRNYFIENGYFHRFAEVLAISDVKDSEYQKAISTRIYKAYLHLKYFYFYTKMALANRSKS